jgi:aspartate-semialdehyde dehydrogenase
MVVALKPLNDLWIAKRLIVSTYQSVSGAGKLAVDQLESELRKTEPPVRKFPHPIAMNVIPQIDIFTEHKYTREEIKMVDETKKILHSPSLKISATCVRVPVVAGHSESVNIEFEKPFSLDEIRHALNKAPGIIVLDDDEHSVYPMPLLSHEKDEVFVGRIRRDDTVANGLNLWIVADNLRKGAATNAVQIAEEYIRRN